MGKATESIYNGASVVVALADVQHVEKQGNNNVPGIMVITKHTRWDWQQDGWANPIWIGEPEAAQFILAWTYYRAEIEAETLADLRPTISGASAYELRVCCHKDYPRCLHDGGARSGGYAVKASECPCHVARTKGAKEAGG